MNLSRRTNISREPVPGWHRVGAFAPIVRRNGRVWLVLPGLPPIMGPITDGLGESPCDTEGREAAVYKQDCGILELPFPEMEVPEYSGTE
ncbi:MAG: hypothetical protein KAW17_07740 [Candidatus Eisenbacteria sp.]|nr:hypothetical protein [Candidatus Eisenbacteria bacterium]